MMPHIKDDNTWKQFRPSLREQFWRAWFRAKGLSWFDAMAIQLSPFYDGWPECYLCRRKRDYLYNFTPLVWQLRDGKMVQVCLDHPKPDNTEDIVIDGQPGNVLVDASTGVIIKLPPPPGVVYKSIRNTYHSTVLMMSYVFRFVWFLLRDLWLWNIALPIVIWWRDRN